MVPPKQFHQTLKLCHPGLSGSPPKRVAVWWGGMSRDPVFSGSFEVRAGFGIGGNLYSFPCRLELQTTSQHGVQRAFPDCRLPPTFWALLDFMRRITNGQISRYTFLSPMLLSFASSCPYPIHQDCRRGCR